MTILCRDCKCELALNASEAPPAQDSDMDSVMVDLGPDRGKMVTCTCIQCSKYKCSAVVRGSYQVFLR